MTELPECISPCSNVRRTCYALMQDPSFDEFDDDNDGKRCVIINENELNHLGDKIANTIVSQQQQQNDGKGQEDSSSGSSSTDQLFKIPHILDSCIQNLNFASWDEEQWHYNAKGYNRKDLSDEVIDRQRFERIALYIMAMDAINFCFWPVADTEDLPCDVACRRHQKNLLEYEHLALALKQLAERDDDDCDDKLSTRTNIHPLAYSVSDEFAKAEDSYLLAPQNLAKLTVETFTEMMMPLLPKSANDDNDDSHDTEKGVYWIPNVVERVRLLKEMAQSLLTFHDGSATKFIASANRSSDVLVHNILQNFPGFRDATVDPRSGRWVAFYKRAQILVADLWAALGSEEGEEQEKKFGMDVCNFVDMDKVTTFADYRVPQLLRSLKVMEYSPTLSNKVDHGIELKASSMEELYIRAATVVAVDKLVENVKEKVPQMMENSKGINAVKMDWYLWNIGEKLDRDGRLGNHHLVRTIYY